MRRSAGKSGLLSSTDRYDIFHTKSLERRFSYALDNDQRPSDVRFRKRVLWEKSACLQEINT